VRDALAWSKYLGEALQMWGGKAMRCAASIIGRCGEKRDRHHDPQQRDLYKFAHDQTIRLTESHGLTATEIAETINCGEPRRRLARRGYYGHIRHEREGDLQK